jgi:hypothetical protein
MIVSLLLLAAAPALVEMQHGLADARFVPEYSVAERAQAMEAAFGTAWPFSVTASLTPNAPYSAGGSHLSFWKPSFVIGTENGGEAGINYWGKFQEGHVNVAFTPVSSTVALDCRMISAGRIGYKLYAGDAQQPEAQGDVALHDGHMLLLLPKLTTGVPVSVELWPTPGTEPVGFFGCDIAAAKDTP